MSVAEDIVFEERERADKIKIPVIALIKSLALNANIILKFWYGDINAGTGFNEFFELRFSCADSYNAALKQLPDLEEMMRNYVVDRIYTDDGPIIINCVRKEVNESNDSMPKHLP
jgi:hypothetical protein